MADAWRFVLTKEAESNLDRLDAQARRRIIGKLWWLIENFDTITPFPLDDPWKGFFKLRVGDWRIMYEVEHARKTVTVHYIDMRDKIYKRR